MTKLTLFFTVLSFHFMGTKSQPFDMLLKGGHVIDLKNNIDGVMDVAISGENIVREGYSFCRCRQNSGCQRLVGGARIN